MNRAILVVNKPKNCYECELLGQFYDDEHEEWFEVCRVSLTRINDEYEKLNNCPLKPMPKVNDLKIDILSHDRFVDGWNKCLDEIIGEEK